MELADVILVVPRRVALQHLATQAVALHQTMRQPHPVGPHGITTSIAEVPHPLIIHISHCLAALCHFADTAGVLRLSELRPGSQLPPVPTFQTSSSADAQLCATISICEQPATPHRAITNFKVTSNHLSCKLRAKARTSKTGKLLSERRRNQGVYNSHTPWRI